MQPPRRNPPPRAGANAAAARFNPGWARPVCLGLLLWAVTVMVFWPATKCDFINYDDPLYFTENPQVLNGLTPEGATWALTSIMQGGWHPTVWLSYMLDVELFGTGPAGPHLTNVALHAANALLVFVLLRALTGACWRSWIVAALFALHPFRVESVAWVSARKDVLSTLFGLLALLMYARYARQRQEAGSAGPGARAAQAPGGRRPMLDYSLALLFFGLGLASKPMLVTLPFVMLLLDFWPLQRLTLERWRVACLRLLVEKIPFFVLGLAAGVITLVEHREWDALIPLAESSVASRLGNAFVAGTTYVGKTFLPVNLALPYPRAEPWPLLVVALSVVMVAGASVAAAGFARRQPYFFVGWYWFLGMLVPVLGLIQWGELFMADRFTYLPSIGLFLLLTWVVGETLPAGRRWKALAGAGAVLALGACALGTRGQLAFWRNSETIFRHALAVTQNNYVANCNLGTALVPQGRFSEAKECFVSALKLNPDYAPALNNLGAAIFHEGAAEDGAACIQRALELDPGYASAHFNLGLVRMSQRRLAEAAGCFETALRLRPDYFKAQKSLAAAWLWMGKADAAIPLLRRALAHQPDNLEVISNLGSALATQGDLEQAILYFRQAVRHAPGAAGTHFNLGRALAGQNRRDEAILEFKETLRLQPAYPEAKQQLRALGVELAE